MLRNWNAYNLADRMLIFSRTGRPAKAETSDDAAESLMNAARDRYRERETTYPIDFAIDLTAANMNVSYF